MYKYIHANLYLYIFSFKLLNFREEDAEKTQDALNERWFGGEAVAAELSPVTNFREACCRDYEMGECTRGGKFKCSIIFVYKFI